MPCSIALLNNRVHSLEYCSDVSAELCVGNRGLLNQAEEQCF